MDLRLSYVDFGVDGWTGDTSKYLSRYAEVVVFDMHALEKGCFKLHPLFEYNEAGDALSEEEEEKLYDAIMYGWNPEVELHHMWYEQEVLTQEVIDRSFSLFPLSDDEDDIKELKEAWKEHEDTSMIIREQFFRYDESDYSNYNGNPRLEKVDYEEDITFLVNHADIIFANDCGILVFEINSCAESAFYKTKMHTLLEDNENFLTKQKVGGFAGASIYVIWDELIIKAYQDYLNDKMFD